MKTSAIIRIVIYSVVAILLVAVLVFGIIDSNWLMRIPLNIGVTDYDDNEYTKGGATLDADGLKCVYVDWLDGDVIINATDGNEIVFSEQVNTSDEDKIMRYKYNNGMLNIKYRRSSLFNVFGSLNKKLTLTIPKTMLEILDVSVVSTKVKIDGITSSTIKIDTVSGRINIDNSVCDMLETNSTSGDLTAENCQVDKLDTDSVSGKVNFKGTVNDINSNSTSGGVKVISSVMLDRIDVDCISGDTVITMPEDPKGFSADSDSVSGDFNSEFPTIQKDGRYYFGNAQAQYNFDSTSGDVMLKKAS